MFRNLYADIRSILLSRAFRTALSVIVTGQIFYLAMMKGLCYLTDLSLTADDIAYLYPSMASFLVTAATLFIIDREFSNGCIRNKLISGVKRTDAFLSAVLCAMLQGVIYTMFACVISVIISKLFTLGFLNNSTSEIADLWLITTMACMAIGVFSASVVMMLGGNKASYVVGLLIAFVMKVWDTRIIDKLYPTKGHCTLTGVRLEVYRFVDRYIPYSYLMQEQHYDMGSYIIGCSAMIIISVVVGLIVFNKRELK